MQSKFVLGLLIGSIKAINLYQPTDSMNIAIDQNINENSFLEATIQAKIEAEEEMLKNGGSSNTIWKDRFMNSQFY